MKEEINKILLNKQELFFKAIDNLFKKDFRELNITGLLSIFDCNPRYLEEKSSKYFIKSFKRLENNLQEEVLEKIELFKNTSNHKKLKVHKLNGVYSKCYSFSVNYKYRIVFQYESKNKVAMLAVGDYNTHKNR